MNRAVACAAAVGVLTGLASTYPWQLGPVASLPVWALVGVAIGLLVGPHGRRLACGSGYGVCLTLSFLYSRFGGAAADLPAYTAFVLAMCAVGALGGVLTVTLGSWVRGRLRGRQRLT